MVKGRFSAKEKIEKRKEVLEFLEPNNEGVASKHLALTIFGTYRIGTFLSSWRGTNRPLTLQLTHPQIEKLALKVKGIEAYAEETMKGSRLTILFHPKYKDTWQRLKHLERLTVYETPTLKGLDAEEKITALTDKSKQDVERSLNKEFGAIYIVIQCPKCGHQMRLKSS